MADLTLANMYVIGDYCRLTLAQMWQMCLSGASSSRRIAKQTACCHSSQTAQRIIRPSSCHQHTDGVLSHRQHRGSSDRHPVTNTQTVSCHTDSREDHETVILSPTDTRRVVTAHRQHRGSSDRHPVTNTQTACCHADSRKDH